MKNQPAQTSHAAQHSSQRDLDEGFRAFKASLKRDYKVVKGRDYPSEAEREIGFHAHMKEKKS